MKVPAVLDLVSNEGTWEEPYPFSVYQRLMDIVSVRDTIPDDDGDNILEAGETLEVRVTVYNRGEADATNVVGVASYTGSDFVVINDTITFGDVPPDSAIEAGPLQFLRL